jgi:hypothetical protein
MKILFITEKHFVLEKFGLTNSIHNLVGSYVCTNIGTYEHLFVSPEDLVDSNDVDKALIERDYDIAFISCPDGINATLDTVKKLSKTNKKIVTCWWDSIMYNKQSNVAPTYRWWDYAPYSPQILFDWGHGEELPNVFCLEVPQDTRIYNTNNTSEKFDVVFAGCHVTRLERKQYIEYLQNNGISVFFGGGRGPGNHDNLSIDEYVSLIKNCKICLNLSVGHGQKQRKGRAFEITACGKFMLSDYPETFYSKNTNNPPFFIDGLDFVSFSGAEILDKCCYYLANHEERQQIADSGYNKYIDNYSPEHFWKKVLTICNLI